MCEHQTEQIKHKKKIFINVNKVIPMHEKKTTTTTTSGNIFILYGQTKTKNKKRRKNSCSSLPIKSQDL